MEESRMIGWVILYCKGELSDGEWRELERWINADEQHATLFKEWVCKYRTSRKVTFWNCINEEQAWMSIHTKIHKPEPSFRMLFRVYGKYAAALLLLIACSFYLYITYRPAKQSVELAVLQSPGKKAFLLLSTGVKIDLTEDTLLRWTTNNGVVIEKNVDEGIRYIQEGIQEKGRPEYNTLLIPRGGEYFLQLADGTKVWLNADSKLTYPVAFGDGKREVELEGEGYFEVAQDQERSFIVKCGHRSVTVLGTKFNVSAYREQPDMIATLVEGSVIVKNEYQAKIIEPGQQAVVRKDRIEIQSVDVKASIAWAQGIFEFENIPLEQITRQLSRWYDVEFMYRDDVCREIHFTGATRRHQDLNVLLELIERLSNVKFKWQGNKIIITK